MDYTSDILARLQQGEDVNTIASALTKSINEANTRYLAEQEAKRKAAEEAKIKAAAEEAARNDKISACENLLDALYDISVVWNIGDDVLDEIDHYDAAELATQLDDIIPALQKWNELMSMIHGGDETPARKAPVGDSFVKKASNPIEDFLNRYVR